jgi:BirA family biotin operon repressor/biotin-[acetyl-CoA-carboxylase] ligase
LREEIARTGLEPTDLVTLGVRNLDRNRLAAALIATAVDALDHFASEGFRAFFNAWQSADVLRGKPVTVSGAGAEVVGRAAGVDSDGALLVETATGLKRFISGEVSVRPGA